MIDIHTHWLMFGNKPTAIMEKLNKLEAGGFKAIAIFILPGMQIPPEKIMNIIPEFLWKSMNLNLETAAHDDFESWQKFKHQWQKHPHTLHLHTFLDIRAWDGKKDLATWWGKGHAGIKGIFIDEKDLKKMAMPPLRNVNDLSQSAYLNSQREVFATASNFNVPLIYHIDLTKHYKFITHCLDKFPNLRVNIPHFGFSRNSMEKLFIKFPALFTDIAGLGPYIAKNPGAYREFILKHKHQVMLGSDALASVNIGAPLEYVEIVKKLNLPNEVEKAILYNNARNFLGASD